MIDTNLFAGTDGGGGVFLSTDNGTSWTAANDGLTDTHIQALAVSGSNLFAGTYGGGVFHSTNYGASWVSANVGLPRANYDTTQYASIAFLAVIGTNLVAATSNTSYNGGSPTYYGGIFLSTNSGANWTHVRNELPTTPILALVASGTNLFAGTDGAVFLSTNSGANWTPASNGFPSSDVGVLAVSGTNLFGTTDGAVWRRPLSEMITGVDVSPSEIPKGFTLEQNYPNPFNPSTTIQYALPHRTHVALTVYNTLGQQVAELINGEMDAGHHEVRFDGSRLASGVYFYRIQAGAFIGVKRLALVR